MSDMTDEQMLAKAGYMVGNPSAWDEYDEGASEIIRALIERARAAEAKESAFRTEVYEAVNRAEAAKARAIAAEEALKAAHDVYFRHVMAAMASETLASERRVIKALNEAKDQVRSSTEAQS